MEHAGIAPSFPSFNNSPAQKKGQIDKKIFEKSRVACWNNSCLLEGSSEQLLSLAIHPDMEFNLMAETEGSQLTYLYQQSEIPSASALKGKGTKHAVGETKNSCISDMFRTHHHQQTTKKSACLAKKYVVSEFSFLADGNTPITCFNFRKISHL